MTFPQGYRIVHVAGTRWALVDPDGKVLARFIVDVHPPIQELENGRDVFVYDPEGRMVMQAWMSFVGRDESTMTREELDVHPAPEQWENFRAVSRRLEPPKVTIPASTTTTPSLRIHPAPDVRPRQEAAKLPDGRVSDASRLEILALYLGAAGYALLTLLMMLVGVFVFWTTLS